MAVSKSLRPCKRRPALACVVHIKSRQHSDAVACRAVKRPRTLAADLSIYPPAAGLLRLAGGLEISEDVSSDEGRCDADGEENQKIDRFHKKIMLG